MLVEAFGRGCGGLCVQCKRVLICFGGGVFLGNERKGELSRRVIYFRSFQAMLGVFDGLSVCYQRQRRS